MCDFSAVRTRLWILLGLLTLCISSAIAGLIFSYTPIFWVGYICLGAAATWATAFVLVGVYSLIPALNAFCDCTASNPNCALPCTQLKMFFNYLLVAVIGLGILCGAISATIFGFPGISQAAITVAMGAATILAVVCASWAQALASCQSIPPPTPPTPPTSPTGPPLV
jgi:hypothetical protein